MAFFRSEPMTLCQIILHTESAFNCLIGLGYEGKVQFRNIFDGNPKINDQYTSEVRRCEELKRIMNHLQEEANLYKIKTIIYPDVDEDEIPEINDLKKMEHDVQYMYEEFLEVTSNFNDLKRRCILLSERLEVLYMVDELLGSGKDGTRPLVALSDSLIKMLLENELKDTEVTDNLHLSFFSGTIPIAKFPTFQMILWRVTKGCCFVKCGEYFEIPDENVKDSMKTPCRKYAFIVCFIGQAMKEKIRKICMGFGIKLFECSESRNERYNDIMTIAKEIADLQIITELAETTRFNLLLVAAADLYIWQIKTNKILMVYRVLNRMGRVRHLHVNKYLQAECWIPTKDISIVRSALLFAARRTAIGSTHSMFLPMLHEITRRNVKKLDKPTYFVVNRFTKGFQNLIDSYGIAQYQELNPAPYTIITFPFLFAVMFADIGHGIIMFLFGLWMIFKEKSLIVKARFATKPNEIFNILFAGRYVITLMGVFSIYTGLIYNDCFSKGFNLFGSSWRINFNTSTVMSNHVLQLDPAKPEHYIGTPYWLGMDPVWKASGENAIITFNSLKMKLAIVLGVAQMVFGLVLSSINFIYRKEYVNLLLVFLPQITFLLCIFAYLVFLIFFKWVNYGGHIEEPYNTACAPSILITFINMVMMKDPAEALPGCEAWMYDTQPYFEVGLLVLAFMSVPVLLAGKPVYYMIQKRNNEKIKNETLKNIRSRHTQMSIRKSLVYNVESLTYIAENEEEEPILSELWIHSAIHCIESVLGSVSHTASYLRLWALSLAHEQLSAVLWNMVLQVGFADHGYGNSLILYFIFAIWAVLTVAILVIMEGLSAFLHTLRLHWVEFQSKFYDGTGYAFEPFKFPQSSPNNRD